MQPPPARPRPNQRWMFNDTKRLGYLPIHKNASTTMNKGLREPPYDNGFMMINRPATFDFPTETYETLVILRPDVTDRWLSAVKQSGRTVHEVMAHIDSTGELWTNGSDWHFQPQHQFLENMTHITWRRYIHIDYLWLWFRQNDLTYPAVENVTPSDVRDELRGLLTSKVQGLINHYYRGDLELVDLRL